MNTKILLVIAVVAVAVAGFLIFKKPTYKIEPPKNSTIVAFGDSLVQGVGATEGRDFVSLVSERLGIEIVNKGRSGDTTASALERINEVTALDPGIVIILLGGNDYLRRMPRETTFQNLHTIVTKFKENDTRVILLGVRGGLLRDTYENDFADFAKREGLPYISNVLDGLIGNKKYMSDEIHPNDLGYEKIADRVVPVLKKVLGK